MTVKYPRTPHLPFSPSYSADDEQMIDLSYLEGSGENIVVTEKMDGENTTLYKDHWHARGLNCKRKHSSRDWMTNFWAVMCPNIPMGWRVCGENLYAKHSIQYDRLPDIFLGFSVWNEENVALSWKDTIDFFKKLGITSVPVLYEGPWNYEALTIIANNLDPTKQEGFVIRPAGTIPFKHFGQRVGKWVRQNHVQTDDKHWFSSKVVRNTKG